MTPTSAATSTPTLATVVQAMATLYPPDLAESWDAVGLVCGDEAQSIRRVLVAVDPTEEVVEEALEWGADLLICHHPRLLRGVHGIPTSSPAGRVVHRLIQGSCALLTAHTNADAANPGVSDALAELLGVTDVVPLQRAPDSLGTHLLVTYVPEPYADALIGAAADAGAGAVGEYRRCAFAAEGVGTYEAPADGNPFIGAPGERGTSHEVRIEMTLPAARTAAVVRAVLSEHPYEEPAYEILPVVAAPRRTGIGRVGLLSAATTLAEFAELVAGALPATAAGVRVAGNPDLVIRRVAVSGGAGDSILADANAAHADVLVTADLRHHRVSDHLADGGCALIDVAHWASEWPWCAQVAKLLPTALTVEAGVPADSVEVKVSHLPTDPWTSHMRSPT
jgi:dinuclear metal center YbgI/SA1388 family protein